MRVIRQRYSLEREVGRGAMGSVWLARDTHLGRHVALKLLLDERLENPELCARFSREAWTIAQLRSPNVVQVFDAGIDEGQPYIVMELLEGESLQERLGGEGLPLRVVADHCAQIAKALTSIHSAGIVHRDLKPANVFIAREPGREVVKIVDFGVALMTSQSAAMPTEDLGYGLVGTPRYMSPEQFVRGEVSVEADLWSLAVIAYEMLTGTCPFHAASRSELRRKIQTEPHTLPSSLARHLGVEVDNFFARALAKAPAERFGSAAEFASDLLRLAGADRPSPIRILLLDDEPDMEHLLRYRFRKQLKEGAYELFFETSVPAGLELLRRRPDIDVVLTDINMPGMSGFDFLSHAPDVNPFVRIIVVSAYSDPRYMRSAMNRGAFDFLGKPIDFDDLEQTVKNGARSTSAIRRAISASEENGIMRVLIGQGIADRLVAAVRAAGSLSHRVVDQTVLCLEVEASHEPPERALASLNAHISLLTLEISARRGLLTRFLGQTAMAVFEGDGHAARAADAALAIQRRIRELNAQPGPSGNGGYGVAIAIDCGWMASGGLGSLELGRLEQVLVGEPVCRGFRLLALASSLEILVSEPVRDALIESHAFSAVADRVAHFRGATVALHVLTGKQSHLRRSAGAEQADLADAELTSSPTHSRTHQL